MDKWTLENLQIVWICWLSFRGGGGDGAADGFLQLLGGAAGGGEGGASSTSNIVKILLGLAKSYFNVKSGSSPAIQVNRDLNFCPVLQTPFFYALKTIFIVHNGQGWDADGAKENQDNKKYLNWALALIREEA